MKDFFALLREKIDPHGSELGLAMTLFSLTVSIRAVNVLEIGRFKGYSAMALGYGLKFNDQGWAEPEHHRQRPEVNYPFFESKQTRLLTSVDPAPLPEAHELIAEAGLGKYVEFVNVKSDEYEPDRTFDLAFIDGDHTVKQTVADFEHFLPYIRSSGLIVIHDYFGWHAEQGQDTSPVRRAIQQIRNSYGIETLLIDTGYMSFVVMRRA